MNAQECLTLPTDVMTVTDNGDGSSTITHTAVDGTVSTFLTWECVDADGDGTPSWLDNDDNDPCVSPTAMHLATSGQDCDNGGISDWDELLSGGDPSDPTDDTCDALETHKTSSTPNDPVYGGYTIGEPIVYTLTVKNPCSTGVIHNVKGTDSFDNTNVLITGLTSAVGNTSNAGIWEIGDLGPGDCVTAELTVIPLPGIAGDEGDMPVDLTNTFVVSSDDTPDATSVLTIAAKPCDETKCALIADNATGNKSHVDAITAAGGNNFTNLAPGGGYDELQILTAGANFSTFFGLSSGANYYPRYGTTIEMESLTTGCATCTFPTNSFVYGTTNDHLDGSDDFVAHFNGLTFGTDIYFPVNPALGGVKSTVASETIPFQGAFVTEVTDCANPCKLDKLVVLLTAPNGSQARATIKWELCPPQKTCVPPTIEPNGCN